MGVTIHFEGRLRNEEAFVRSMEVAAAFAREKGWTANPIAEETVALSRVRGEEDWDYLGPTKGLALDPHASCDPVRLEFDRDLYVQEFVKTQFAPIEIHLQIVELLRALSTEFEDLQVEDEGEYWDTSNPAALDGHRQACFHALKDELAKHPDHVGPVRLSTGRIVDLMSRE
jgi:hypothetical protein